MIELRMYSIVIGGDKKLQVGPFKTFQKWSNDAFYEQFDIFDEKAWADFIVNYRVNGKRLAPKDANGNYQAYAIIAHGGDVVMRDHFGGAVFAYLFPQDTSMKGKTKKLINYNKKYIYPRLR